MKKAETAERIIRFNRAILGDRMKKAETVEDGLAKSSKSAGTGKDQGEGWPGVNANFNKTREKVPPATETLHRGAERQFTKKLVMPGSEQPDLSSFADTKKVLHELQIYQSELEMQKEELQRAQEELIDSQRKYADLFDFAPVGYMLLDSDGLIGKVNNRAADMLGTTKQMLLGQRLSQYVFPSDLDVLLKHRHEVFSSAGSTSCTVRMLTTNGRYFHTQLESTKLEQGADQPSCCLTSLSDVSKLKEIEKEREEYIRGLENFSYASSHELQAPLTRIAAFIRIITEDHGNHLSEEGEAFLGSFIDSARKMERLMKDLLDFLEVSTKKFVVEKIDPASLARSAYDEAASHMKNPTVTMNIGPLPLARGDAAMIRRVFIDLISNSLKFTRPKTNAMVEVCGERGNEENTYYVSDNGAGVDGAHSDMLFRIFQRLQSAREFPGTRTGLSIVKRIIEKHGGRTWEEAKPGQGATVYFTLPTA